MKIRHIFVLIFSMLMSSFLLTGCHTTKGFGMDMQEGGQAIQKAATKNHED